MVASVANDVVDCILCRGMAFCSGCAESCGVGIEAACVADRELALGGTLPGVSGPGWMTLLCMGKLR